VGGKNSQVGMAGRAQVGGGGEGSQGRQKVL